MGEERITDSHGQTIGYYRTDKKGRVEVRDKHRRYLGVAKDRGTFDQHGRRVSWAKAPGLLLSGCR